MFNNACLHTQNKTIFMVQGQGHKFLVCRMPKCGNGSLLLVINESNIISCLSTYSYTFKPCKNSEH